MEGAREGPGEDRGCLCAVGAGGLPAGSWCQSSCSVSSPGKAEGAQDGLQQGSSRVPAELGLFLEPVMGLRVVIPLEGKALVRACLVLSSTPVESMWVPAAPSPSGMWSGTASSLHWVWGPQGDRDLLGCLW